ncbi:Uncharacterised protein [Ewingella americana]|uniref:Uncharacterized protein n=1 Tax=Ewingella americana TaxID=41202 RepID=A0A377NLQ5_9GAMM|nr:Uncharacterised protein [Ewingella americana]
MISNNNIPTYSIRGINLCGFNDMDHLSITCLRARSLKLALWWRLMPKKC